MIERLSKSFGENELFSSFSAQVARGDRIALVGDNGVGKSTLLSLIAGVEAPTAGKIHRVSGLRIAYLPQIARIAGEGTLFAAMQQPFAELFAAEAELRQLESRMAKTSDSDLFRRYDELLHTFERKGGYAIDAEIRSALSGVGFTAEEFDKPLVRLSGGKKARAALARVLLEKPDLLLLDEPTNHLDFAALDWLEERLAEFSGGMILVSHDRHLLDRLANRTWEIAFAEVTTYQGGYAQSRATRAANRARHLETYEQQQATIEQYKAFIRRHHAGQKHRQAKDRERKLARIEKTRIKRPHEAKRISLDIGLGVPSGRRVLTIEDLAVGFTTPLFTCPQLVLYRGERAAIIGENGCGKTTFLRTITGEIAPLSGRVTLGHNVKIALYNQTQEDLRGDETALDAILAVCDLSIGEARGLLAHLRFCGDEVKKPLSALSGGERSRLALAMLSLMEGNLLLLDEPTNHLDLQSQEILQEALAAYDGTILFVSHDRALLGALATQIWEIREGTLRVFPRLFREYQTQPTVERTTSQASKEKPQPEHAKARLPQQNKPDRYEEKRRAQALARVEGEVAKLEEKLKILEQKLVQASQSGDGKRIAELGEDHKRTSEQLEERYAEWERLSTQEEECS